MSRFTLPHSAHIVEIHQENYRTKTFTLDIGLGAAPGQFAMLWQPRFDEKPFSLVNGDPVTVMITDVGPFSHLMHEKQVGDRIWLRGPLGRGFHVLPTQRRIVLVGGGYGVAPLHWLARMAGESTETVTTIIGARSALEILFADAFADLSQRAHPHHQLLVTTEDGSLGTRGRVTDALLPLLERDAVDGIYACGPHGMLAALAELASRYSVPHQLSWEAYMRCGIGICGACEHNGKVLCMDGPVLIEN